MRVAKWDDSLAVRLPEAVVEALGLEEGDDIEIRAAGSSVLEVRKVTAPHEMLARLRKYRGRLPAGFRFDRQEANGRGWAVPRHERPPLPAVGGPAEGEPGGAADRGRRRDQRPSPQRVRPRRLPQTRDDLAGDPRGLGDGPRGLPRGAATLAAHEGKLALAERYGFTIYDGLILAAASLAGCTTLHTADLQDGQRIEELTISNLFALT
jgi:antitoxin MazE